MSEAGFSPNADGQPQGDQSWRGSLGVISADGYDLLVCSACGQNARLVPAAGRDEHGKAYVWIVCNECGKVLTAIDNAERIVTMITIAKAGRG